MPAQKVKEYLDSNGVRYVTLRHSTAYTAQEIAESAHIKGRNLAKTVVVRIDGKMALAVLPADCQADLKRLKEAAGAARVELAEEDEFAGRFPGVEVGAMPPFGNLYGLPVYADRSLAREEEIAFNAGTHTELIQLSRADYERLVSPVMADFAVRR